MAKLDLSSLEKVIQALSKSIKVYHLVSNKEKIEEDLLDTLMSGVIQNFEVAFEQSWKFMKKWIEENANVGSPSSLSKKELFRTSAEHGLIANVEEWFELNLARNLTSHTYNEGNAVQTFEAALKFESVANDFLSRIKSKND